MAYKRARAQWLDYPKGDTPILAENLNHIEDGIASAAQTADAALAATPAGVVVAFAGNTPPMGWLLCKGQSVPRGSYPNLFAAIGTTYGSVDASTFNVPDLSMRYPIGVLNGDVSLGTVGATGGERNHSLTVSELPSHTHKVRSSGSIWSGGVGIYQTDASSGSKWDLPGKDTGGGKDYLIGGATGGNAAHNNLPPYVVMNYIIKV